MPTFIKPGFWEKAKKGYDHWLNLDDLIAQQAGVQTLQQVLTTGDTYTDGTYTTRIVQGAVLVSDNFLNTNIVLNYDGISFSKGSSYSVLETVSLTAPRTITLPDASGTVALTNNLVTKVQKTTITSAQVKQLFTTPITVLPSATTGKVNIPTNIYIKRNAGTAYTLNTNALLLLDGFNNDTNNNINPNPLQSSSVGYMNTTLYIQESLSGGTSLAPYKLKAVGGNPTLGTGDLDVYVTYIEITL